MTIAVVIVDEHTLFREGLRALLARETDLSVVGDAGDARSAYELVERCEPDIVLMAIELGGVDGIAATREVLRRIPRARIVVVSRHESEHFVAEAIAAGADGYVLKTQTGSELALAIREVHAGTPHYPKTPDDRPRVKSDVVPGPLSSLSKREREVFRLVVRGFTNAAVAQELRISIKTVETHRAKLNRKLDVHSTADLVRLAAHHGLVG
jgi:DNA-binding NarL/FixJ family response regulator